MLNKIETISAALQIPIEMVELYLSSNDKFKGAIQWRIVRGADLLYEHLFTLPENCQDPSENDLPCTFENKCKKCCNY